MMYKIILLLSLLSFDLSATENCFIKLTCKSNLNYVCDVDNPLVKCQCPNEDIASDTLFYTKICEEYIPLAGTTFPKIYYLYSIYKDAITEFNSGCVSKNKKAEKKKTDNKTVDPEDIYVEVGKYCGATVPTHTGCKTAVVLNNNITTTKYPPTAPIKTTTIVTVPEDVVDTDQQATTNTPTFSTKPTETNTAPVTNKTITTNSSTQNTTPITPTKKPTPPSQGVPQIDVNNPNLKNKGEWVTQIKDCKDFVISIDKDLYVIEVYNYAYAKNPDEFVEKKIFRTITDANNYLNDVNDACKR